MLRMDEEQYPGQEKWSFHRRICCANLSSNVRSSHTSLWKMMHPEAVPVLRLAKFLPSHQVSLALKWTDVNPLKQWVEQAKSMLGVDRDI